MADTQKALTRSIRLEWRHVHDDGFWRWWEGREVRVERKVEESEMNFET